MRNNVEETKDLVAVHNLSEGKLVKSLQLGGLPMPSIAIARARDGHSDFGEISLVFNKNTIDPEALRSNKVYSGDAYTPTYPRVEYKASEDVKTQVYDRLKALRAKVDPYFAADIGLASNDIDGMLQNEGGEEGLIAKAAKNYGLKAAYLEEQGTHIAAETRQEEVRKSVSPAMQNKYVAIMDVLNVDSLEQIGSLILKDVREQYGEQLEAIYPGITKTAFRLSGVLTNIREWLNGTGDAVEYKTVTDASATRNAVDSAIDQKAFEQWVRELYRGVEEKSGMESCAVHHSLHGAF